MAERGDHRDKTCPAPEQVPNSLIDQYTKHLADREEVNPSPGKQDHFYRVKGTDLLASTWEDKAGKETVSMLRDTKSEQVDNFLSGKRDMVDFVVPMDGGKSAEVSTFKGWQKDYFTHQKSLIYDENHRFVGQRAYELDSQGKVIKSNCFEVVYESDKK